MNSFTCGIAEINPIQIHSTVQIHYNFTHRLQIINFAEEKSNSIPDLSSIASEPSIQKLKYKTKLPIYNKEHYFIQPL